MKKIAISFVLAILFSTTQLLAQTADGGDFMRSIGKMYVVVAVLVAMFIGIVFYLISLDRKLTKLENQIQDNG
ncbi:MAG: CcmD family protein [Paraglaciecola sp.]|jgi:CcmD family protein